MKNSREIDLKPTRKVAYHHLISIYDFGFSFLKDHIISAVLLTKKDTFLTREEYHQLLYASCVSAAASRSTGGNFSKKICTISFDDEIKPLLPAIWKPKPLWTGKQVNIRNILKHKLSKSNHFVINILDLEKMHDTQWFFSKAFTFDAWFVEEFFFGNGQFLFVYVFIGYNHNPKPYNQRPPTFYC